MPRIHKPSRNHSSHVPLAPQLQARNSFSIYMHACGGAAGSRVQSVCSVECGRSASGRRGTRPVCAVCVCRVVCWLSQYQYMYRSYIAACDRARSFSRVCVCVCAVCVCVVCVVCRLSSPRSLFLGVSHAHAHLRLSRRLALARRPAPPCVRPSVLIPSGTTPPAAGVSCGSSGRRCRRRRCPARAGSRGGRASSRGTPSCPTGARPSGRG